MSKLRKKVNGKVFVVIAPDHAELAGGALKSILRQANITREDFLKLL
jgi:predicted RNA binding protein YcfA (HicA-like mRNA interferase family)